MPLSPSAIDPLNADEAVRGLVKSKGVCSDPSGPIDNVLVWFDLTSMDRLPYYCSQSGFMNGV